MFGSMNKLMTELIGTFFYVLVFVLTGNPLAVGVMLMVMVYMGGHISGAHYNPAVTLGFFLRGKVNIVEAGKYWVFQMLGAILAGFTASYLLAKAGTVAPGNAGSAGQWLLVEGLFTFALCLVVFNVADTAATKGNSYYGLAIGLTITAAAFAGGKISGGAFNPAVGLGPNIVALLKGNSGAMTPAIWLYTIGPCVGSALAVVAYKLQANEK